MNPGIEKLQPYPFEQLAGLLSGVDPGKDKPEINLSLGEPGHPTPPFILEELQKYLATASSYPKTRGSHELRAAIADWLQRRFSLPATSIQPDRHVLPVNGTREALFAICQCIIDGKTAAPLVVTANPFYQIYEGAALLAGASPWYINSLPEKSFLPDYSAVPDTVWRRCQLLYLCSPNNPTGSVVDLDTFQQLLQLAERYDFVIAADECYSEIYLDEDEPPMGLLEASAKLGNTAYERCLVFHSLSKRSSVPGIRSGFVAGDATIIEAFYRYRTYHGCAMAPCIQQASIAAWRDEEHVRVNRRLYREKFRCVHDILAETMDVTVPPATFYLWLKTPGDDTGFARGLYRRENVTVLPGSYLSREVGNTNPGRNRVRIALVAPIDECREAAGRIADYAASL